MPDRSEEANILKEKGNTSLKDENYEEAVVHYTHALKIDDRNPSLYNNRSLAFLKLQQFYFALEDAKEAIRLQPDSAKGYFRKGEVEFSTYNLNDALFSYTHALMLQPKEPTIELAIKKTMRAIKQDEAADNQISWIGAAVGIFIGATVVVADRLLRAKPTLTDPILMVLITFAIAIVGYGAARGFRYYIKCQRIAMLEPPLDLLREQEAKQETHKQEVKETRNRYSKAQARHRYKKGRL